MGLSIETGVPVLTVFLQGLLSFFSPCVLPLVPLYVGYLAEMCIRDSHILEDYQPVFAKDLYIVNNQSHCLTSYSTK